MSRSPACWPVWPCGRRRWRRCTRWATLWFSVTMAPLLACSLPQTWLEPDRLAHCTPACEPADPRSVHVLDVIGVPLWAWGATVAGLILLVAADLVLGGRQARELRLRAAALRPIAVAALAVLFGTALAWIGHPRAAGQLFAGLL